MRSWIIALAVTGLFLQPVLTLGAALPLYDFSTLALFLVLNGILIFGLVTGVTLLVGLAFRRPDTQRRARAQPRSLAIQPHLNPQQFIPVAQPEQRDVC